VTEGGRIIDALYLFMNFAKNAEFSSRLYPSNQACFATEISGGCNQVNIDARCGLEFRGLTIWKVSAVALFWDHTSRSYFIPRVFLFEGVDTLSTGSILICMTSSPQLPYLCNGLPNSFKKSRPFWIRQTWGGCSVNMYRVVFSCFNKYNDRLLLL
jgi:hypothetical protein